MSITSPDARISTYSPVVPTTDFPALFPVFDNDDLIVVHDGVERTDFAVSATYVEGISNDAKAVFAVGITGDVKVVGRRAPRRTSRFSNGGPLPVRDQNLALDTLEAESQEQGREIERAVRVEYGEPSLTIDSGIPDNRVLMKVGSKLKAGPDIVAEATRAETAAAAALSAVPNTFPENRSLLKATDTETHVAAYLREPGREGQYLWKEGDYAAKIAADTGEGVYLKADNVPATAGSWVRQDRDLTPEMFGVIGDGMPHSNNSDRMIDWLLACDYEGKRGVALGGRTYLVGNTVLVPVSNALEIALAPGSVIKGEAGPGAVIHITNAAGKRPQLSLTGDCGAIDNSLRNYVPGTASGTGLALVRQGGINVKGVKFQGAIGFGDSGIAAQECGRGVIENCTFYDQSDIGVYLTGGASTGPTDDWGDIKLIDNHFERCEIAATARRQIGRVIMAENTVIDCGAGLQCAEATSGATVIGFDRQIIITNNHGKNIRGAFIDARMAGPGSLICDNDVVDWGMTTDTSAYGCIGSNGVLISGNTAIALTTPVANHAGISLNDYTAAGGTVYQGENCTVSDNYVYGANTGVRDLSGGNNQFGFNRLLNCATNYAVNEARVLHQNASGVGVGTSNPQAPLHVVGKTRIARSGVPTQYVEIDGSAGFTEVKSFSDPTAAKGMRFSITTDNLNTPPTSGNCDAVFDQLGVEKFRVKDSGQISLFPFAGTPGRLGNGDMWLDGTANQLKVRINGVTRTVTVT